MDPKHISTVPAFIAFFAVIAVMAMDIFAGESKITGAVVTDSVKQTGLNGIFLLIFIFLLIGILMWAYKKR